MTDLTKIKSPLSWPKVRAEIETALTDVIGRIPNDKFDLQVKTVDETDFNGYTRRRVNYFVDPWTRIGAWVFIPDGRDDTPGLLCCHQRVPQGKDEAAGLEGDTRLAFAQRFAELGYATIAPDCILAGERLATRQKPYDSKAYYKDNPTLSVAGKMVADHIQALNVLMDMRRVDPARVGVIGHGLGAFNALMLAAFDSRVQACVASSGFTRFETDKNPERWVDDDGLSLMPKLQPMIEAKKFTFDWEHIIALAAPSPILVITSLSDSAYANPKSCQKAMTLAGQVYKVLGASNALYHYTHHDGDRVAPETMEIVDDWFERWL
jgi:dienelactone hydrolase